MPRAPIPKPWKAEYAKTARSSCKICKKWIGKEKLRLGKMVRATQFDDFMPRWNHVDCVLRKTKQPWRAKRIKYLDDVEGLESLRLEDQQKIRNYVEGGSLQNVVSPVVTEYHVEVSEACRATCRRCYHKIKKGEVRISTKTFGAGCKSLFWHHASCFMESSPNTEVETLSGWDRLSASDKSDVLTAATRDPSVTKHGKQSPLLFIPSGAKRKRTVCSDQKSKFAKTVGNSFPDSTYSLGNERTKAEQQLEAQTKELWELKDDLRKHVKTAELREMLEVNAQDPKGSEIDLRERCADGMLFGALPRCSLCSGCLHYSGGMYRCHGYLSAWSRCSYSTIDPERVKGKWRIPEETSNVYLRKLFELHTVEKPVRVLPISSYTVPSGSEAINELSRSSDRNKLGGLKIYISGFARKLWEDWKRKIEGLGGLVHIKIKNDTNCVLVSGVVSSLDAEIWKARRMKLPIVREDHMIGCIKGKKKLPIDLYRKKVIDKVHRMVIITDKGKSSVHEESGLQNYGHVLEDTKIFYSTVLNMTDLSTGVNRYYILQIIEDERSTCYVF